MGAGSFGRNHARVYAELQRAGEPVELDLAKSIIFKGATVIGIHGRLMYKTWFQMQNLLKAGKLDLSPVITDRIPMKDFSKGMDRLKTGESSKILLYPNGQE